MLHTKATKMKFKKTLLIAALLGMQLMARSQTVSDLHFFIPGKAVAYARMTIDDITIYLNSNGKISLADVAELNGKVDYYDGLNDGIKKGKLKSIGSMQIDYYDGLNDGPKRGKIKVAGNIRFDYYDGLNDGVKRGKAKSVGSMAVDYYDGLNDGVKTGKLKSVGNTQIQYYDGLNDGVKTGLIKRIGATQIDYYDGLNDGVKTGKVRSVTGSSPGIKVSVGRDGHDINP